MLTAASSFVCVSFLIPRAFGGGCVEYFHIGIEAAILCLQLWIAAYVQTF
jgi:hypothetical protein